MAPVQTPTIAISKKSFLIMGTSLKLNDAKRYAGTRPLYKKAHYGAVSYITPTRYRYKRILDLA
jgi:hypothetical protein